MSPRLERREGGECFVVPDDPDGAAPAPDGPASADPGRGRDVTWLFSLLVGFLLAPLAGALSGPFWDGSARSLIPVWLIVAAIASAVVAGVLRLTGRLSVKRFSMHLLLAAIGFGLFYLGTFLLVTLNRPDCSVEAAARLGYGVLSPC